MKSFEEALSSVYFIRDFSTERSAQETEGWNMARERKWQRMTRMGLVNWLYTEETDASLTKVVPLHDEVIQASARSKKFHQMIHLLDDMVYENQLSPDEALSNAFWLGLRVGIEMQKEETEE